ncbi:MAG: PadR family transcriptional regulator [Acidimicrobiales bacterium]
MLPAGWLRGVLDPCLLSLLSEGEAYGYELAGRLEAAGLGRIPGGTLYPALLRLEKQQLLSAEWRAGEGGPGRKYYRLSDAGRAELAGNAALWGEFATSVAAVLAIGAQA